MSPRTLNPPQSSLDGEDDTNWSHPPSEAEESPTVEPRRPKTVNFVEPSRPRRRHSLASRPSSSRREARTLNSNGSFNHATSFYGGQIAHGAPQLFVYPRSPLSPQFIQFSQPVPNGPPFVPHYFKPAHHSNTIRTHGNSHHQTHNLVHYPAQNAVHYPTNLPSPAAGYGYATTHAEFAPYHYNQPMSPTRYNGFEMEEMRRKVRSLESKARKEEERQRWRAEETIRRREDEEMKRKEKGKHLEKLRRHQAREERVERKRSSAARDNVRVKTREAENHIKADEPEENISHGGNSSTAGQNLMNLFAEFIEQKGRQHNNTRDLYEDEIRGYVEPPRRSVVNGTTSRQSQHMVDDELRKQIEAVVIDVLERQSTIHGDQDTAPAANKPLQTTFGLPMYSGDKPSMVGHHEGITNANVPLSPGASSSRTVVELDETYSFYEPHVPEYQNQFVQEADRNELPSTKREDQWPARTTKRSEESEQAVAKMAPPQPNRATMGEVRHRRTNKDKRHMSRPMAYFRTDSSGSEDNEVLERQRARYFHQLGRGSGEDGIPPKVPDLPSRSHR